MRAYNRPYKPKHMTKVKMKTFGEDYFPTWLSSKRVGWIDKWGATTIKYKEEKLK